MNFSRIKKLEECVCQLRQGLENGDFGGGACMQMPYAYDDSGTTTPAAGLFQLDGVNLYINILDANGNPRGNTLGSITTGFVIFSGNGGELYYGEITSNDGLAGSVQIFAVTDIDGFAPANGTEGCFLFIPVSATVTSVAGVPDTVDPVTGILFNNSHFSVTDVAGVANVVGIVGVQYEFSSTTTAADPGSGIFRTNNNDFSITTEIYLNNTSANSIPTLNTFPWNIDAFARRFIGTHLVIPSVGVFLVKGAVDNSGWSTLTVQMVGHAADAINGTKYDFQFQLSPSDIAVKTTAANYTVGTDDPRELYGGVIRVTAACTITIPAVAAGMHFTVITIGAVAVVINPDNADKIYLDGTALADGDSITNLSTAGNIAVISYAGTDGFDAITNGWTDTN
jgi:hypothetical protein